jgi:hypothetical protein
LAATAAATLVAALAIAEVTKDVACTPVAAVTVAFVSPASGVTTEFVPIPGILMAGAVVDVDVVAGTLVVEPAVTTTVLGDDTITTDTVAGGAAVVVVVVVP